MARPSSSISVLEGGRSVCAATDIASPLRAWSNAAAGGERKPPGIGCSAPIHGGKLRNNSEGFNDLLVAMRLPASSAQQHHKITGSSGQTANDGSRIRGFSYRPLLATNP